MIKPFWNVIEGDCVEQMSLMPASSVDAVVCDPPYGLEFMGKEWDRLSDQPGYVERGRITSRDEGGFGGFKRGNRVNSYQAGSPMQAWHEAWAREALRVLKAGGHLLAFGGTRTYHRLVCAIEDAGFEIRDCVTWLYGQGFPKSLDVSKAIDKAAGVERQVVGRRVHPTLRNPAKVKSRAYHVESLDSDGDAESWPITRPATQGAERWQGWGTALKPAFEPIVVARKPLAGTVAANVQAHGTGALNIDGCRVDFVDADDKNESKLKNRHSDFDSGPRNNAIFGVDERNRGESGNYDPPGRWPANVVLDEVSAEMLDVQTGGKMGVSRFFYCAKTPKKERNAGVEANKHPTVKPITLMRWLVRLVTPPNGIVLDPFVGSGTTGCAAVLEGFDFVGIERDPEYLAIAQARIAYWSNES